MKKIGIKFKKNRIEYLPLTWNHWGTYLIAWRKVVWGIGFCCCCSVVKLCPSSCNPINSSSPDILVLRYLPHFAQTHVHWVDDAIKPSHFLPPPPLLLPSIFPSIRVFPDESALCIRWPKYWSFSFSPFNEYDGGLCQRLGRKFTLIVGVQLFPFLWGEGSGRGDQDGEHM